MAEESREGLYSLDCALLSAVRMGSGWSLMTWLDPRGMLVCWGLQALWGLFGLCLGKPLSLATCPFTGIFEDPPSLELVPLGVSLPWSTAVVSSCLSVEAGTRVPLSV